MFRPSDSDLNLFSGRQPNGSFKGCISVGEERNKDSHADGTSTRAFDVHVRASRTVSDAMVIGRARSSDWICPYCTPMRPIDSARTQIVFVGEPFEGTADRVIDAGGKLVIPGFIDTHLHSGHRASHRLISDVGRPDYFGQLFFEISVPRAGTRVGGDPRYARPDDAATAEELLLNARFTVAELLSNGITTFVEFGSQLKVQEALDAQVNEFGIRAYLGPGFDSGRWVGGPGGRLTRVVDEAAGERELALALDFIEWRAGPPTRISIVDSWRNNFPPSRQNIGRAVVLISIGGPRVSAHPRVRKDKANRKIRRRYAMRVARRATRSRGPSHLVVAVPASAASPRFWQLFSTDRL